MNPDSNPPAADAPLPTRLSPMMQTYARAQAAAPGHLILYRVAEFYEALHENAGIVSRALGVQLTRRAQKNQPDIPMAGIPAASAEAMAARLLVQGHKIAFSEQPTEPGGDRPLRLLSPATTVDDAVLAPDQANILTIAEAEGEAIALVSIDLSTGETTTCMTSIAGVATALARTSSREVVVTRWPDGSDALAAGIRSIGATSIDRTDDTDRRQNSSLLNTAYGHDYATRLRGFSPLELSALSSLLAYLQTAVGRIPSALPTPRRMSIGDTLEIDAPTLRGLEVLTSAAGKQGSLLAVIDRTVSAAGARLLRRQLAAPLTRLPVLERRLAMVRTLVDAPQVRSGCREMLSSMPDMLRACGRLSLGKAGPRDLAAIRDGLDQASALLATIRELPNPPPGLLSVARDLAASQDAATVLVRQQLKRALAQQLPSSTGDGNYIAAGYDPRLDGARTDQQKASAAIEALQSQLIADTGIKALRIRSNSIIGFHVEVPANHASSMGNPFTLRQGLASTTRYSHALLDSLASDRQDAVDRVIRAEQTIFTDLSNGTMGQRDAVTRISQAAAALDLVAGLAQAAAEHLWTAPELTDNDELQIEQGRHPISEALLEASGRTFVPNDCAMEADTRLWLLTGPNMAGKSTFLRQVAIIILMAQIGSYVPARRARISVVDKMFSRIGAADDLAAGRSTFMVEMLETAAILNQATPRSFVILDEVGRGTSTQDGLAIAQACMEYLHDTSRCRTLFATHYHELCDPADRMPHAICMAMEASAGRHDDMFSYQVRAGRAEGSYGLRTATIA